MKYILRIEGKAHRVFNILKNMSQQHPHVTLAEVGQKGLLKSEIQHTIPYEFGKFPEVWLDNDTENN